MEQSTGLSLSDLNDGTGYMVDGFILHRDVDSCLIFVVFTIWMGLSLLAASCAAIWEATRISDFDIGNIGKLRIMCPTPVNLSIKPRPSCYGFLTLRRTANTLPTNYYRGSLEPLLSHCVSFR